MNRSSAFLAAVALALGAGAAAAQPAPPAAPPAPSTPVATESFLEQRVIEELAADGIVLSRLGVVVDIQLIGTTAIISLVETSTSRAVASTKVDRVPADRDTAVATVTPVAANLVSQIAMRGPKDDSAELDHLRAIEANQRESMERAEAARIEEANRAETARLEANRVAVAEQQYREEAIRFGSELELFVTSNLVAVNRKWTAHRGETDVPLEGADFYRVIGRQDLVDAYDHRKNVGKGFVIAAGIVVVGGIAYALMSEEVAPDYSRCPPPGQDPYFCRSSVELDARLATDDDREKHLAIGALVAGIGGGVLAGIGTYYLIRPNPVDEGTARRLGAEHNRKVRERLGLPVPTAPAALASMRLTPYVNTTGGGLALSASF